MKETVNQVISSLATISWGVVPVYLYASGLIGRYLAPTFHLIALIGGLAMIVLGLFNLLNARRKVGCGHDHSHEEEGEDDKEAAHDHHQQSPVTVVLVMILPVLLCSGFTKHEYSTKTLMWKRVKNSGANYSSRRSANREPFTRERLEQTTSRTEDGHYILTITELFWSAGDKELMKAYVDLPAELQGRIIDEEAGLNPDGNRKRLYRVFMTCCAADAQVYGVALEFDGPLPDLADKTWIKVGGTVAYETVDGQTLPYLKVTRLETTPEPPDANPFGPRR